MANDAIQIFDGTQTTVISGTSTLADANFSTSTTATETAFDNSTDLWPMAKAVLSCSFTTAPDDQSPIDLYIIEQNIDGTNDVDGPTSTDVQGAIYIGSFKVHNVTTQQYQAINISLMGVQNALFSIQNNGGQTMDSDFTVKIEGFTLTPST